MESNDHDRIEKVISEVRGLITMLEATSVRRVRVESDQFRIEVERAFMRSAATPAAAATGAAAAADGGAAAGRAGRHHEVLAPLVGTFYRAPSPGAKPYVDLGDRVQAGQTIGIIEVMKVMNEVTSDHAGVVKEILVADGESVEYEQPLMIVEPSGS